MRWISSCSASCASLPAIVQLHDGQGFDEQCGARSGLVVDESGDPPFELRTQGDDITTLTLRNDGFLQELGIGGGPDNPLEPLHQVSVRFPQLTADAHQRIAGRVQHLPTFVDAAADLVHHVARHGDALRHVGDVRELLRQPAKRPAQRTRVDQGRADGEQVQGSKSAADGCLLHERAQIVNTAQVHVAFLVEQPPGLARLGLPDYGLANVICGRQRQRVFPPERKRGVPCEPVSDLVELQHAQSPCVHVAEYSTAARSGQCFPTFGSCGIIPRRLHSSR